MTTQQVRAVVDVKSENFHQVVEESVAIDSSNSYEQLIDANERLRVQLSKIFTEFVNKARAEQEANGDQKKRKAKPADENEDEEEDGEPQASDNEEDDEEEEDEEEP